MLQLKNILKTYKTGDLTQTALSGVSVNFRENEFVAILGQSGSGKTTLLNIIGGLDRYDSGDLIIRGTSTKEYKDSDWDTYRNHSIGFVFQSYNLIPHQTVLSNVELALTLSGVPKAERRQRAKEVLCKVGLGDQLHKKPNQMSGGQMQRVAIARALINNPDILLADEPTGALDSETSTQVIDLLKEISEDKLIIMVTHNPEIAGQYANRIIRLKDGKIIDDSNPYTDDDIAACAESTDDQKTKKKRKEKKAKTSMSFFTALALSLNNLLTKKGRTFLTSFAGSIGIIGIALILALSNGFQAYINSVQADTLSSYPLSIESSAMDLSALMSAKPDKKDKTASHADGKVYSNSSMVDMMNTLSEESWNNNLKDFKTYLEKEKNNLSSMVNAVKYSYGVTLNVYASDTSAGVKQVNPSPVGSMFGGSSGSPLFSSMGSDDVWDELLDNQKLLNTQYDVLAGKWPQKYNEVVLIVDANNEVNELTLQALGVSDAADMMKAMQNGESYKAKKVALSYDDILKINFKLVLQPDYYSYDKKSAAWVDKSGDEKYLSALVNNGKELKVVGIVRPNEQSVTKNSSSGSIGYLKSLTEYVINETNKREIVKQQKEKSGIDVFTGLPFKDTVKDDSAVKTQESTTVESTAGTSSQKTTGVEQTGKTFAAPVAGNLEYNGAPATASFMESTAAATTKVITEDDVYAYIKANFSGTEQDKMNDFAKLFLKDTRSLTERKQLISYLDEMIKDQNIEGMGSITGEQAYAYIQLMNKDTKLQMLSRIIEEGSKAETTTSPQENPEQTTASAGNTAQTTIPSKPAEQTTAPAETTVPATAGQAAEEPVLPTVSGSSLKENLSLLGVADLETPITINIYPKNFEAKDRIVQFIKDYNTKVTSAGKEENVIEYTDYVGLIMSSVTKIINIVSYVLIAFVSISLVVSSIMIGIITYISVLERTKEIGILRAIGASKKDISRVFNAETLIVGLAAGILGIGATLLLCIPMNMIIEKLTEIAGVARLPFAGGVVLIIISIFLTTIAGLIPSKMAAKKDPVVALRTE